jgi:CheY-like chemotaxis protein
MVLSRCFGIGLFTIDQNQSQKKLGISPAVGRIPTRPIAGCSDVLYTLDIMETKQPDVSPEILVVDDEPVISRLLKEFLRRQNFSTRFAASAAEALAALQKRVPDLMILDIYMPGISGVELLRDLHHRWPTQLPFGVIILTGSRDEPLLEQALALGAFEVVLKPVSLEYLDLAIWTQLAFQPHATQNVTTPSGPPWRRSELPPNLSR